ncbi:MAG: DMT family transporter [Candidatus Puniceispirillales bacterium]
MLKPDTLPKPVIAALCAMAAVFCFSLNDSSIKFLSGEYALHQIVLLRSTIGMAILIAVFVPFAGTFSILKTRRLGFHLLRGLCVVFANMTFFLGISAMPLAEGTAIFFVSPLLITVFSVIFLKERVGVHRWAAVLFGLIGVLVILRPGTASFALASLLPIAAAVGYASLHMLTRHIGKTESALTMSFYIQITFIFICTGFGVVAGDGRFAGQDSIPLEFLFRAWGPIAPEDWIIFIIIGVSSAFGGFFISQAYRIAEAGMVAPFEYIAMPLSIFWGFMIFDAVPGPTTLIGMAMILLSGLYVIWRETVRKSAKVPDTPRYRR